MFSIPTSSISIAWKLVRNKNPGLESSLQIKKSENKAKILCVVIIQVIQIHIRNLEKYSIKRSLISTLILRNFGSWQIDVNAKGLNLLLKNFYVISIIPFSLSGIALNYYTPRNSFILLLELLKPLHLLVFYFQVSEISEMLMMLTFSCTIRTVYILF